VQASGAAAWATGLRCRPRPSSCGHAMAVAGTRIHPITLIFTDDPSLENHIRERQFQAASPFYMMVLGIILPIHLITPLISERYGIISLIYAPLIVVAIGVGIYYGNSTDVLRAHRACSCVWLGLMTVGPGLQRLSIYAGQHPRVEPMQAVVYMGSYVLVILVWYMMHFDFRHKMYMTAAIFLSLSTAGLEITGDEGWTSLGQPYDTIITGVTVVVGNALGYSIERMLRLSFLQRQSELRSISGAGRQSSMPDIVGDLDELVCPSSDVRYDKVGLLGRGGTGDVFLVRRLYRGAGAEEGPLSAMKRISKARLQPAQRERVLEECEILKNIAHPFIVRLENAYETQHYFLLEMTYAGGGDLTYWMGRFTAATARQVSAEVLLALEYLHEQSVMYRDVKLENTLVALDGHVLLADFGVSKRLFGATTCSTSTLVGTPEYMAPEQVTGEAYSFEVDFWALAVMLHEVLTSMGIGSRLAPVICDEGLIDSLSTDLLRRMLVPDRTERLGHGPDGINAIKAHAYFEGVDFQALLRREGPGPLLDDRSTSEQPGAEAMRGGSLTNCSSFEYRRLKTGSSDSSVSAEDTSVSAEGRAKQD